MRPAETHLQDQFYKELLERHYLPKIEKTKNKILYVLKEYLIKPSTLLFLLLKNNYPVIITSISNSPQTIAALLASKLRGSKCILWIEEWKSPKTVSPLFSLSKLVSHAVIRSVDAIVVEGTPQYAYVRKLNIPQEKVFFANHCSLDYSKYPSKNLKNELNIENFLVILYVGRILEKKGVHILIMAFSRIEKERNNVALIICGNGEFLPFCKQLADKLKLKRVFFLGEVEEEKMASIYKTADVFVLPSCSDQEFEGWGLVINEAMSMGLPIITTDNVGAAYDLVKENINGYIVKKGDINELYRALTRILDNEELRTIMGRNSRKIFEEFNDFDKMFKGFKQAIDYVVKQNT
jgi:glycosyltransferase involved in cell wall biosynthesis